MPLFFGNWNADAPETDKIAIIYSNDHEVRYVRMNQPHPARVPTSGTVTQSAITKVTRW